VKKIALIIETASKIGHIEPSSNQKTLFTWNRTVHEFIYTK